MADVEIIGSGHCPKCDAATRIKSVNSWPFPEDEQHRIIETCTVCDFEVERNFSSSDATSSIEHERVESARKARIARVVPSIAAFQLGGDAGVDIAAMMNMLSGIEKWDFHYLYVDLMENSVPTEVRGLVKMVERVRKNKA